MVGCYIGQFKSTVVEQLQEIISTELGAAWEKWRPSQRISKEFPKPCPRGIAFSGGLVLAVQGRMVERGIKKHKQPRI